MKLKRLTSLTDRRPRWTTGFVIELSTDEAKNLAGHLPHVMEHAGITCDDNSCGYALCDLARLLKETQNA